MHYYLIINSCCLFFLCDRRLHDIFPRRLLILHEQFCLWDVAGKYLRNTLQESYKNPMRYILHKRIIRGFFSDIMVKRQTEPPSPQILAFGQTLCYMRQNRSARCKGKDAHTVQIDLAHAHFWVPGCATDPRPPPPPPRTPHPPYPCIMTSRNYIRLLRLLMSFWQVCFIKIRLMFSVKSLCYKEEISQKYGKSVPDPWHFGADPDPWICTSD
jgi:hypothetical protein